MISQDEVIREKHLEIGQTGRSFQKVPGRLEGKKKEFGFNTKTNFEKRHRKTIGWYLSSK